MYQIDVSFILQINQFPPNIIIPMQKSNDANAYYFTLSYCILRYSKHINFVWLTSIPIKTFRKNPNTILKFLKCCFTYFVIFYNPLLSMHIYNSSNLTLILAFLSKHRNILILCVFFHTLLTIPLICLLQIQSDLIALIKY